MIMEYTCKFTIFITTIQHDFISSCQEFACLIDVCLRAGLASCTTAPVSPAV